MKTLFSILILFSFINGISQSLYFKDLKYIYNTEEKDVLQYLKLRNTSWAKGADEKFLKKIPEASWWTVMNGPSSSIAKSSGDKFKANVFLITASLATTRQIREDIEAIGMKSINDSADFTDGYYIITFNAVKDDYGETIFSISFARKEYFGK